MSVEAYPNTWTHHVMLVMIGTLEEVDEELLSWIVEAAEFAKNIKRQQGHTELGELFGN